MATAVQGRPEGATIAACGTTTDIVPEHAGIAPSDTPFPYSVDLNDFTNGQYIPGDTYTSKKQMLLEPKPTEIKSPNVSYNLPMFKEGLCY